MLSRLRRISKFVLIAALALGAARASAQSIVGGELNVTVTWGGPTVYLDFDNSNGVGVLHHSFMVGDDFGVAFNHAEAAYFRSHVTTTLVDSSWALIGAIPGLAVKPLSEGVTIDASLSWLGGNQQMYLDHPTSPLHWGTGRATSGFIGVSFFNSTTGMTNYGFVEVFYDDPANSLTLLRYAYDESGAAIVAGASLSAIPEPSTYAALAGFAALGFVAWRRRSRGNS